MANKIEEFWQKYPTGELPEGATDVDGVIASVLQGTSRTKTAENMFRLACNAFQTAVESAEVSEAWTADDVAALKNIIPSSDKYAGALTHMDMIATIKEE